MLTIPEVPKQKKRRSLAVLTSGGDAPGMNAAIRSVVRFGLSHGCRMHGISKGYSGLLEGNITPLESTSVANIIQRGGTILKTDRCEAFFQRATRREAANILIRNGIDGLVVIGGDGSFTGAHLLENETGFPTIGIPGTIDNDIAGTDDTIGFDTAVNTALAAIDRIRDTASSHDRIFLIEVMGRSSGFIGLSVGIGGGAETMILPESQETVANICKTIERGSRRGKTSSIIVVAEGKKPGLSARLARDLWKKGYTARVCILGHTQRGGSPSAHDRLLASVLGASAVAYLLAGKSNAMVGVREDSVVLCPFRKVVGFKKSVDSQMLHLAKALSL
ncbi:MAG: 6-phosphofructokinase [Bdellovibrionales bacterium RIFOXYC1_FULL_54_43]|nr:MAG: 6-phosphofructokinase [Bdellovibrionales bacterium RIFOXYC1_FULL_54_43]OFZ79815.1 MAG: 6-phosphofructokinase [Bdellovibrionales bacterium RIFOXYD1_FULL_55_31]